MKECLSRYDFLWSSNGPMTTGDFINDTPNKLHNELYSHALAYFIGNNEWAKDCDIIEKRDQCWWKPSYIVAINRHKHPMERGTYWLGEWWHSEYVDHSSYNVMPIGLPEDSEIDYIDYVNGKAILSSKYYSSSTSPKIDFKNIHEQMNFSDDYDVYPETFEGLLKNRTV